MEGERKNKKRKRTKKKETLIRMRDKGGNCTLPTHARRQRPDQAAHLHATDFSICRNVQDNA